MSTPYQRGYEPPFPQIEIAFEFDGEHSEPFAALIDSGADVTMVPETTLEQIGAWTGETAFIRSQFGELLPVRLYLVSIQIENITLPGIYVVGHTTSDEIILGRDVLNKLVLLLDGPEQQTELLDPLTVNRIRARRTH